METACEVAATRCSQVTRPASSRLAHSAVCVRGGLLAGVCPDTQEVVCGGPENSAEPNERGKARQAQAAFESREGLGRQADAFGELALGEPLCKAQLTDTIAQVSGEVVGFVSVLWFHGHRVDAPSCLAGATSRLVCDATFDYGRVAFTMQPPRMEPRLSARGVGAERRPR